MVRMLIAILLASQCSAAHAAIVIQRDFMRDLFVGPTIMMATPGQALTYVGTGSAGTTGGGTTLNCVISEPGCTGGPGIAVRSDDLSSTGFIANGSGTAGADSASSSVSILGTGFVPGGFNTVDVLSGDFQQLRFNVSGSGVPEFIDVDITFSISATVDDNTTGTTAFYFPFASGGVEVLEASTLDLGTSFIFSPFSAIASTSDGQESLLNSIETFSVRPNADYWVRLITLANVTFFSDDFTGVDVNINGYADPMFALNPLFAAANPDVGAALVIEQVSIVPLPAAALLFGPTMFGLALWSRRKKRI